VLSAAHLTRRFGNRVAVQDFSLDLAPGEIFALLGPNGAGKTTTLRMLAGLIAPTSGSVRVNGEPMSRDNASRLRGRIGLLTEAPGLWDRLTVRQNLMTYASLHGLPTPGAAVDAALDLFDIMDRAHEPAADLSKGLKQRVALARALLHRPDIVLLDEPTSGLDPESARDVRGLVLRLRDERRAVLLSTHNLDEVERIATRVAVLSTSLIAVNTPAALRTRLFGTRVRVCVAPPAARFVEPLRGLGFDDVRAEDHTLSIGVPDTGAHIPHIVRRLVEAGADIHSVVPDAPPLEEIYLRLLREQRPS
jgi:ABC-2 type transport system ATP-binding protein